MKPYRLIPEGRGENAKQHSQANYRLEEFRVGDPIKNVGVLPVAGLPLRPGESHVVRRGKTRPAVVLAIEGTKVEATLKVGAASWQHKPAILMAPYYGVDTDGSRGGWKPEFVNRIQRAEYSQYVWDALPIGGTEDGSILRLDHLFPIGADNANWQLTEYRLRDDALLFLDEWLEWHLTGGLDPEGLLAYMRTELAKLPGL